MVILKRICLSEDQTHGMFQLWVALYFIFFYFSSHTGWDFQMNKDMVYVCVCIFQNQVIFGLRSSMRSLHPEEKYVKM